MSIAERGAPRTTAAPPPFTAPPAGALPAEYLPAGSAVRCSDAVLALVQARVLAEAIDAAAAPSADQRAGLRARVEQVAKALGQDAELRGLPGHEAELRSIQRNFDGFIDVLMEDVLALGPIGPLLADPEVTEIAVNGVQSVYFQKRSLTMEGRRFLDEAQLRAVLGRILEMSGAHLKDLVPFGEARLAGGGQIVVTLPPIAPEGPAFLIRRIPGRPPTLAAMVAAGALTPAAASFLAACVRARVNVVVTGGTRAGKSRMLNALCNVIQPTERIVVVEDRWQLALTVPNRVSLQTSASSGIDLERLIQVGLRMQPDRIVVGECAGPEVLEMLLAMNAGCQGSLTSAFASSPADLIRRFSMFGHMAGQNVPDTTIAAQIGASLDLIVHMQVRPDGSRVCSSITAIDGSEDGRVGLTDVFQLSAVDGERGTLAPTGMVPRFHPRLERSGIVLPEDLYGTK